MVLWVFLTFGLSSSCLHFAYWISRSSVLIYPLLNSMAGDYLWIHACACVHPSISTYVTSFSWNLFFSEKKKNSFLSFQRFCHYFLLGVIYNKISYNFLFFCVIPIFGKILHKLLTKIYSSNQIRLQDSLIINISGRK